MVCYESMAAGFRISNKYWLVGFCRSRYSRIIHCNAYFMIKTYFKVAWRNLGKSKMHSFINIAGLSLAMAVAMLIGLWIYDEVSFNKNFKNCDRIAQVIQNVTNNGEVQTWRGVPYP